MQLDDANSDICQRSGCGSVDGTVLTVDGLTMGGWGGGLSGGNRKKVEGEEKKNTLLCWEKLPTQIISALGHSCVSFVFQIQYNT